MPIICHNFCTKKHLTISFIWAIITKIWAYIKKDYEDKNKMPVNVLRTAAPNAPYPISLHFTPFDPI